jgi:mono/diheme cytochrome c family protein
LIRINTTWHKSTQKTSAYSKKLGDLKMSRPVKLQLSVPLALGATLSFLAACQPSVSAAFSFPEGDAEAGAQTFVELGCVSCHSVTGAPAVRDSIREANRTIPLGGEQTRVYTYGELVTSIVNPSHKISQERLGTMVQTDGQTNMINYNDVMTVTQLTDLVTFLEAHYTLKPFERSDYVTYPHW